MIKSLFCVKCEQVFNKDLPYTAKHMCNPCYQSNYVKKKMGRPKSKLTHCKTCELEFGTLNPKGKAVKKGARGYCKSCFHKENRPSTICSDCNEEIKATTTKLCQLCKIKRGIIKGSRAYIQKPTKPVYVEYEEFELIRRLLVRYKLGMNNMVDDFRVVDVYLTIKEAPAFLDTLNERYQVTEMLKTLKETFDYFKTPILGVQEKNFNRNDENIVVCVLYRNFQNKKIEIGKGYASKKNDAEQFAAKNALDNLRKQGYIKPIPDIYNLYEQRVIT
jgi:hypothetical protein